MYAISSIFRVFSVEVSSPPRSYILNRISLSRFRFVSCFAGDEDACSAAKNLTVAQALPAPHQCPSWNHYGLLRLVCEESVTQAVRNIQKIGSEVDRETAEAPVFSSTTPRDLCVIEKEVGGNLHERGSDTRGEGQRTAVVG